MPARDRLVASLQAVINHIDAGGIQDTALPGTDAAEATRLMKNGLSVSTFACFEHFIRERLDELLLTLTASPGLPPFEDLPEPLQLAATKGVVEALRFQMNQRRDNLDATALVAMAQKHAAFVASTATHPFRLSDWSFAWASSNVGPGVLGDFLTALRAPKLFQQIPKVLQDVDFDYAAAGLADGQKFVLGRLGGWRHAAAHDATAVVDLPLLRTRVTAYLAVAFAFDLVASFATRVMLDEFAGYGRVEPDPTGLQLRRLVPVPTDFLLETFDGTAVKAYYSWAQCKDELLELAEPLDGAVIRQDAQGQLIDWFFH